MTKRRHWRGVSDKVAKDKAEIYNSREWKELRVAKLLSTRGLCEDCLKEKVHTRAQCVHHIVPIETARTKDEMKRLAFDVNNLRALCFACHARIHKEMGSNTAKIVRQRAEARQDRWADNLIQRFVNNKTDDNGIQAEVHERPVRETGADRATEAQARTSAQTDTEGNGGS